MQNEYKSKNYVNKKVKLLKIFKIIDKAKYGHCLNNYLIVKGSKTMVQKKCSRV